VLGFTVPEHGDCELCSTAGRALLRERAQRVSNGIDLSSQTPTLLPILNNAAGISAGCGGCAAGA